MRGSILNVKTAPVFRPLQKRTRYRGARGGRGSGKSHFFAEDIILDMVSGHYRVACAREMQNSIKDSSKQLLEDKIRLFGLENRFVITEREIYCPRTESLAIFRGLQSHTAGTLKSLEGYNRLWCDEAQALSQKSLDTTTPTFRAKGSMMDFSWNPVHAKDPIERMFNEAITAKDPDFTLVNANWNHNPWFPADLHKDMERDKRRDPGKWAHVWEGKYLVNSEAQVYRNWQVREFETPRDAEFYFGLDFGFAVDATAAVRCFIRGTELFIDHEVYGVGVEIDKTPDFIGRIPGIKDWPLTADNARPETISYLRRHGFPRIRESIKGKGSVEDGIEFLRNFDIVVHPRCPHTIEELTLYSFKIDPKTDEILPIPVDKDNHVLDAARYAVENLRRSNYHLRAVS